MLAAAAGLIALPFSPTLAVMLGADGSWDASHHVRGISGVQQLMRDAMGVRDEELAVAAVMTTSIYGMLMLADALSERARIRWPASWHCENTECYDEMFCEPTRASLVRRPGNTYSNILYLFGALVIAPSAWSAGYPPRSHPSLFQVADAMFGGMLLALATLSTIWHASNAPKSQYIDLWAMDSCIAFLIVRMACIGLLCTMVAAGVANATAHAVAATTCALLFAAVITLNATKQIADSRAGLLDGGCPFAGRRRLQGRSPLGPVVVAEAALFLGLPILFMLLPFVVQVYAARTVGSRVAHTLMIASLSIGWGYRATERFFLDGCAPMNLVHRMQARAADANNWLRSTALTALAALVSPTAVLHFFTGVTLVIGYVHARTVDACLDL